MGNYVALDEQDQARGRSSTTFLRAAANYFRNRPTGGEDSAHWANVYNAENCEKAALEMERLQALAKELSDVLLTVKPLGGSECFVKRGEDYYADPKFFRELIKHLHDRNHQSMMAAVRAEKALTQEREQCAKVAEACKEDFLSEEYAVGQPTSSFEERFACDVVAAAIRSRGQE